MAKVKREIQHPNLLLLILVLLESVVLFCLLFVNPKAPPTTQAHIVNPASEHCTTVGGTLSMQTRGDGGQYGLCQFEDNRACEEWALYRGDCPVGGVKTTGYDTIDQKYCAWVGGQTVVDPNATCTLPNGKVCMNTDVYKGACQ